MDIDMLVKLVTVWRIVFVVAAMSMVAFAMLGIFGIVPITKSECIQMPVAGVVLTALGFWWIAKAPPPETADGPDIVAKTDKEWRATEIEKTQLAWNKEEPPPGIIQLARIPKPASYAAAGAITLMPKTKYLKITRSRLFSPDGDGWGKMSDGVQASNGMKMELKELGSANPAFVLVLFAYSDEQTNYPEKLKHLLSIE